MTAPHRKHRTIGLLGETLDGAGPRDTGLSHAIALAVGEGTMGETLRLHRTGDVVAFGRQDMLSGNYARAVAVARSTGCTVVERLAGGRAAAFHHGTLAFSWAVPTSDPRTGIQDRFALLSEMMVDAFRSLGVDATVGEVPGEYCPGAYSVGVAGRLKVMGVGQRLVRGAAHVGGVVVVDDSERLRQILSPVYSELGLEWEPASAGALTDVVPGIDVETVRSAVLDQFAMRADVLEGTVPDEVGRRAEALAATHVPEAGR